MELWHVLRKNVYEQLYDNVLGTISYVDLYTVYVHQRERVTTKPNGQQQ